ncbi:MAG: translation initiation factor IF-6 [Thermoprotei archaeon]|nr:MAG: translation initiation factor IF-6 [Thermoprotei archaeon]RLF00493.1 MAG: translation initiation factor IF-6 [Thermoprotei archaeon]
MSLERLSLFGVPSIGVFIFANNEVAIIPPSIPDNDEETIREILGVDKVIRTTICGTNLVGVFIAGNDSGILVPANILENELSLLKRELRDLNLAIVNDPRNALGNLILANNKVALVSPYFKKNVIKVLKDNLNVEIIKGKIAESELVGTLAIANNRGVLLSALAQEEDLRFLSTIFKLVVDVGTVNRGSPFLRAGMLANDKGALVGDETTGPEILRIQQILLA